MSEKKTNFSEKTKAKKQGLGHGASKHVAEGNTSDTGIVNYSFHCVHLKLSHRKSFILSISP